ncbi:uncharacterized protein L201_000798 [Kwoniella dendrophila CBS 6074]|uniref:BTB domain-containing protein n=1 Tax=Kwoniella dendrophila CBS 6074 TaxID=1295534 RepID=A0AAX4JM60_9TREE
MSKPKNQAQASSHEEQHRYFSSGDLTFMSNDGKEFKVYKEVLLANGVSEVFQELFEPQEGIEDEQFSANATPIHIDCSKGALEGFLSILVAPIPMLPPSAQEDLISILRLCYQYECKVEYTSRVRQRISEAVRGPANMWKILEKASEMDDRILGRIKGEPSTHRVHTEFDRWQAGSWQTVQEDVWAFRYDWENIFEGFDSTNWK